MTRPHLPILPRRVLGRTGLEVSVMGLGSGGPSQLGQRRGATADSAGLLVRTALDQGMNMIDTAPGYGASEELLGEALIGIPRSEYILATKFNPYDSAGVLRPMADLKKSLEQSLQRLGTDFVEVFYLHAVPAGTLDAVWERFAEPMGWAVEAGLARFTGITEAYANDHEHATLVEALDRYDFDVVMAGYNLLSPSAARSVFPRAASRDVGVVIMCAIRGVIADPAKLEAVVSNWKKYGWLDEADVNDEQPLDWLLTEAESIASAAYKFAAAPETVSCVLTGTASPDHLIENVEAITGPPLSPQTILRLTETFGKVNRNVGPADAAS
jgi:aryl-alcohol dehydrogenase-like predicted oxidoreductase